eukprot:376910_1
MSQRRSKRGRRKKKTNLTDRKRHNTSSKNTYMRSYYQNKKLKKEIERTKQALLHEQRMKHQAKQYIKTQKLKHNEELNEIIYENDHGFMSEKSDDCDANDSDFVLGDEEIMDAQTEKDKLQLIGFILKILDLWIERDVKLKQ